MQQHIQQCQGLLTGPDDQELKAVGLKKQGQHTCALAGRGGHVDGSLRRYSGQRKHKTAGSRNPVFDPLIYPAIFFKIAIPSSISCSLTDPKPSRVAFK